MLEILLQRESVNELVNSIKKKEKSEIALELSIMHINKTNILALKSKENKHCMALYYTK